MTLDELIDLYTPQVSKAFRDAIAEVVDAVVLADVTRAIELGDPLAAFNALGFSQAAMRPMVKKMEDVFEAGGIETGRTFPKRKGGIETGRTFPKRIYTNAGPTVYRFDMRNSRAEKWTREQAGNYITRIDESTKTVVRNKIFEGIKDGDNPRKISLELVGKYDRVAKKRIGGVIGLNEPQEKAVAAMRKDLQNLDRNYFTRKQRDKKFDSVVEKMFKDGKVSGERVEQLTTRYKDKLLKLRGDTIARDATMEALNRAEWEATKQADDLGAINKQNTKRIWDSAGEDGRTRPDHLTMDGQEVGLEEPFLAPDGDKLLHPQDRTMGAKAKHTVNCRCRVRLKVDWLSGLDAAPKPVVPPAPVSYAKQMLDFGEEQRVEISRLKKVKEIAQNEYLKNQTLQAASFADDASRNYTNYVANHRKREVEQLHGNWKKSQDAVFKMNGASIENSEKMKEAGEIIRNLVHPKVRPTVNVQQIMQGRRASYDNVTNTAFLANDSTVSVAVHEAVHAMEFNHPTILEKTTAFLKRRAGGADPVDYNGELGFEDKWVERGGTQYAGRDYSEFLGSVKNSEGVREKQYKTIATEILTTGIERLLADPLDFAELDPDYFNFIMGIFRNE